MSASITLSCTKAVIFEAYTKACERELQALRDLEAQRLATSIAEGHAALVAPRPTRTFMQNGVLMHKVAIGFNRFAIRPVQVAQ